MRTPLEFYLCEWYPSYTKRPLYTLPQIPIASSNLILSNLDTMVFVWIRVYAHICIEIAKREKKVRKLHTENNSTFVKILINSATFRCLITMLIDIFSQLMLVDFIFSFVFQSHFGELFSPIATMLPSIPTYTHTHTLTSWNMWWKAFDLMRMKKNENEECEHFRRTADIKSTLNSQTVTIAMLSFIFVGLFHPLIKIER